jgi:hypothetical protein
MELDYEKDMQIDPDALDVEWLNQAPLALRYGKHLIEMRERVMKLEEKKKVVRSELIQEANENPEGCCKKAKPNAADIEAFYRTSERYKAVVKECNEASFEQNFAELAKNEICYTRKAALENLVVLHGQQYFAGPKVPRNISKEWEKARKEKQANEKVLKAMKRKGVGKEK